MEAPFVLRFRLARLDLAAWVLWFAMRFWLYWVMAFAAASFLGWQVFHQRRAEPGAALSALLAGTFLFVVMWIAMLGVTILLATFKRTRLAGTEVEMTVGESGIRTVHADGGAELKWTGIQAVKSTRHHLFLCLAANQALVVPRRAVADDARWEALLALCRRRLEASR